MAEGKVILADAEKLVALGQRAIDYVDTGLCVFCDADDVDGRLHESHCNVGELSRVVVTEDRVRAKIQERALFDEMVVRLRDAT